MLLVLSAKKKKLAMPDLDSVHAKIQALYVLKRSKVA